MGRPLRPLENVAPEAAANAGAAAAEGRRAAPPTGPDRASEEAAGDRLLRLGPAAVQRATAEFAAAEAAVHAREDAAAAAALERELAEVQALERGQAAHGGARTRRRPGRRALGEPHRFPQRRMRCGGPRRHASRV